MAEWVSIASLVIWSTSAFRLPSRSEWRRWEYWWAFAVVSCGILGAFWSIVPVENASSLFTAIRTGPPLLLGALLALSAVKKGAYVSLSAAALIAVFVPMIAVSVATLDVGMILLAVVAVLPAVLAPSEGYGRESIVAGFTGAVPVALILIGVQVVAQPGIYIGQCRGDKCSVWGEALGPLGLGNALGVCLAVLGPLTMLVVPGVVRMLGAFLASAILVDLTSSRSALIGFAVAAFVAIVYRWQLRRIRRQSQTPRLASAISGARGVLLTGVALIAGVLSLLPLYPWQAGAFTGRADLWSYALGSVIPSSPIFGHGSSFWVRQANTVELQANYATHNLLTEILVSGGLWSVLWLSVCVVAAMRSKNSDGGNLLGVAVVGIWLSSCLTEVSSAPGRLYLMASLFPLVLVIAQARDRSAPRLPSAGTPLEAQTTKVDIDNPTPAQ